MPKDVSSHKSGTGKGRYHAYKPFSKQGHDVTENGTAGSSTGGKWEWEEATCPICMDYPHNAVLLCCSSYENGCRPYMCNTSYRHSNCLDQYQKAHLGAHKSLVSIEPLPDAVQAADRRARRYANIRVSQETRRTASLIETGAVGAPGLDLEAALLGEGNSTNAPEELAASSFPLKSDVKGLLCPLCRGTIKGWKVVQSAREHLNHKARNCAQESCSFSGNYEELRVHARRRHPLARPSEVDPDRQRDWRRLERRRAMGDVLSTIHSSVPSSTAVGDTDFDDDFEEHGELEFEGDDGHWWTVFSLFQIFGPANSVMSEGTNALHSQNSLIVPARRVGLWGESSSHNEIMVIDSSSESSDSAETRRRAAVRRRMRRRADRSDF